MGRYLVFRVLAALGLVLIPAAVAAATITVSEADGCDYHLKGQIAPGDAALLDQIPATADGRVLCLDSPGGSLAEGKRLFDEIWDRNIITRILPGESCESACSLAFLGGSVNIGTAVIRVQQRSLAPGAKLGFHAPSLSLPDQQGFEAKQVNAAFEVALKAAESFFEIKLTEEHSVRAMTDFLYQRVLGTRPETMFHIETVGDAVLANITLSDFQAPRGITEREISNICDNAYAARRMDGRPGYSTSAEYYREIRRGDYDDERRTTFAKTSGGYLGKVYNYFDEGKFVALGCSVRIPDDWAQSWNSEFDDGLTVWFNSYSASTDFEAFEGEEESVPIWYLLAPETPIAADGPMEVSARTETAPGGNRMVVRLSGYDLHGGDLEDGVIRNVDGKGCWEACEARGDCDVATHDRWNRICFLKSTSASRRQLSLLSKADTYALPDKANILSPDRNTPVKQFTRLDKAFSDSPDEVFTADSLNACQFSCAETLCLGFNWIASAQRCELFEAPGVYVDGPGTIAGFMVQPAPQ